MNNWFYAHNGEQRGPVSQEELTSLAASGQFTPAKDLVWREGMSDWKKVSEVPELNLSPPSTSTKPAESALAHSEASTNDPYKSPAASSYISETTGDDDLPEIEPGSTSLGITECIARAFELTKRYFGIVLAVWAIYLGIAFGISVIFSVINTAIMAVASTTQGPSDSPPIAYYVVQVISQVISQLLSVFFTLGLARFGLNLISGKPAGVGLIFSQTSKLLAGFLGSLLIAIIVYFVPALLALAAYLIADDIPITILAGVVGLIPASYFGMKYSQFFNVMVDRDSGIFESLRHSAALTQNNKWALLGLYILIILISIAGVLAFCVGIIFTVPMTWLASLLVYRWLKHGPAGMQDRGLLRVYGA
ncbi:MAG: DUF4339 domain-containing protein [Roseibacillus sp.]